MEAYRLFWVGTLKIKQGKAAEAENKRNIEAATTEFVILNQIGTKIKGKIHKIPTQNKPQARNRVLTENWQGRLRGSMTSREPAFCAVTSVTHDARPRQPRADVLCYA